MGAGGYFLHHEYLFPLFFVSGVTTLSPVLGQLDRAQGGCVDLDLVRYIQYILR